MGIKNPAAEHLSNYRNPAVAAHKNPPIGAGGTVLQFVQGTLLYGVQWMPRAGSSNYGWKLLAEG